MQFGSKVKFNTVVGINEQEKSLIFYSMLGDNKANVNMKRILYKCNLFDEEFFSLLSDEMGNYARENPSAQAAGVSIIVPDNAIITDTINIPAVNRKAMANSFRVAVDTMYVNHDDMKVNPLLAASNKQYGTFGVTMMKKQLIADLNKACSVNKLLAQVITFPANGVVNAVSRLRPKYKRSSYMFLDIKENYTRICFAAKGRATAAALLSFGFSILSDRKLAAEDMLFDHTLGDITVINAKEKARAKQLTMLAEQTEDIAVEQQPEQDDSGFVTAPAAPVVDENAAKSYHKQARKLPKFMVRPTPEDANGFVYENFRIFVKWALLYLRNNEQLVAQGEPEFVLVNMPNKFDFLYEKVNADKDIHKIEFVPFDPSVDDNPTVTYNLELFGGFYSKNVNPTNIF